MVTGRVKVCNEQGIHARPSSLIVKLCGGFECDITLTNVDKGIAVNAKSLLEVMMLAAGCGTEMEVTATGTDEQKALEALTALIAAGFEEE